MNAAKINKKEDSVLNERFQKKLQKINKNSSKHDQNENSIAFNKENFFMFDFIDGNALPVSEIEMIKNNGWLSIGV